jgi:hypothetical protein
MQRPFGIRNSNAGEQFRGITYNQLLGDHSRLRFAAVRNIVGLFCCGSLVQAGLATIGGVPMDDPIFGCFVESRNRRANLIGGALRRQTNLFLQSAQVRLNAPIMCRSFERLSGTFTG